MRTPTNRGCSNDHQISPHRQRGWKIGGFWLSQLQKIIKLVNVPIILMTLEILQGFQGFPSNLSGSRLPTALKKRLNQRLEGARDGDLRDVQHKVARNTQPGYDIHSSPWLSHGP